MRTSAIHLLLTLAGCGMGYYLKRGIGWDCPDQEGQHHVVLTTPGNHKGHCGGSLLSSKWIITALHCDKTNLVAIVGKHPTGQGREKIIEDKDKYKFIDNNNHGLEHDLMLIKIDNDDTSNLTTIPLPDPKNCASPDLNTRVDMLGWMTATLDPHTEEKYVYHANRLQCGHLKVVKSHPPHFYARFSALQEYKHQHLLSAMGTQTKCDGCQGDSGSSLLSSGKLHGVLVMSDDYFCGDTVDFMNICHTEYRDWIFNTTGL